MSLNPVNMNAPNQITINITGQITLHCKNVEPVLRALQIQTPAAKPMTTIKAQHNLMNLVLSRKWNYWKN